MVWPAATAGGRSRRDFNLHEMWLKRLWHLMIGTPMRHSDEIAGSDGSRVECLAACAARRC
jgi:hypothetical protein